jgi:hypothetical protein
MIFLKFSSMIPHKRSRGWCEDQWRWPIRRPNTEELAFKLSRFFANTTWTTNVGILENSERNSEDQECCNLNEYIAANEHVNRWVWMMEYTPWLVKKLVLVCNFTSHPSKRHSTVRKERDGSTSAEHPRHACNDYAIFFLTLDLLIFPLDLARHRGQNHCSSFGSSTSPTHGLGK